MTRLEPEISPITAAWPPKDYSRPLVPSFFTRVPEADKTVTWPPRDDDSRSSSVSGGDPSQTTHLREEVPIHQEAAPVYHAQPVVSAVLPARGELKWPPEGCQLGPEQIPMRIQTPRLSRKSRADGFSGQPLPQNYSGYRAAPGVLHMSPDAQRYIADAGTSF